MRCCCCCAFSLQLPGWAGRGKEPGSEIGIFSGDKAGRGLPSACAAALLLLLWESIDLQGDLSTPVKLSRPSQFSHFMPRSLMLQPGSLFLLYLEARAEFSLISIGTRCIPKHTSVARKKLPNKEPSSHNTEHEALF